VVERSAVNRLVASSNLAWGVKQSSHTKREGIHPSLFMI
jgi:hypothetical protein